MQRVSERMFDVLRNADGARTLRELAGGSADHSVIDALARELVDLWTVRMVALAPRT
jgi:hypothetical protein